MREADVKKVNFFLFFFFFCEECRATSLKIWLLSVASLSLSWQLIKCTSGFPSANTCNSSILFYWVGPSFLVERVRTAVQPPQAEPRTPCP